MKKKKLKETPGSLLAKILNGDKSEKTKKKFISESHKMLGPDCHNFEITTE